MVEIEELRNGNHFAYEQLFIQWYEPLCKYANSILNDMDEAEDITQKVFCKLWDLRSKIEIHTSIKSYLYRAVHNDCLNRIKQIQRRTAHNNEIFYESNDSVDTISESIEGNELMRATVKAMNELPPQCRKVFKMSRFKQMSYAEIAAELNISTNTVENHIAKALRLLRLGLKDFLLLLLFINK